MLSTFEKKKLLPSQHNWIISGAFGHNYVKSSGAISEFRYSGLFSETEKVWGKKHTKKIQVELVIVILVKI